MHIVLVMDDHIFTSTDRRFPEAQLNNRKPTQISTTVRQRLEARGSPKYS